MPGGYTALLPPPGAWIITGGSHAGVMKQVGEAVRDFTLSSSHNEGEVVTVGVATWGTVHNREDLIHPSVSLAASRGAMGRCRLDARVDAARREEPGQRCRRPGLAPGGTTGPETRASS